MRSNTMVFCCVMVTVALCFSGCCGRLIDWCKETVPQSASYKEDKKVIKHYTQSIRLYDEFQMIAMFDALWLSDDIRTLYATHYSRVRGNTLEATTEAIRRQLQTNEATVSFYVLSLRADPLHITNPSWIVYLDIDGRRYQPQEIKFIELLPYYVALFGKLYSNHKQACEIKFSRFDQEGADILKGKIMTMRFSNQRYYGSVSWDLTAKVAPQDFSLDEKKCSYGCK